MKRVVKCLVFCLEVCAAGGVPPLPSYAIQVKEKNMVNFVLGSLFGGTMGVITMCLCTAAKWSDEHIDSH